MHGPYPGLTDEQVREYIQDQIGIEVPEYVLETFAEDAQSHNQYEQHCFAVKDAKQTSRIQDGVGCFAIAKTLQPWARDIRVMYYHRFENTK